MRRRDNDNDSIPALRNTPNQRILLDEKLFIIARIDLGNINEAQQLLIRKTNNAGEIVTAVANIITTYNGERYVLEAGPYSGGKHGCNGTYFTKQLTAENVMLDEDGPTLTLQDNRLIENITYGHGSGFCAKIDNIRETLDENTGETAI